MPRFRRRLGARFGRPFAKRKQLWVTSIFNETAVSIITTPPPTELVLLTGVETQENTIVNQVVTVRRTIFNGSLMVSPSISDAAAVDHISFIYALYTIDTEDTDAPINTALAGGIMQTERVMHTGVVGRVVIGQNVAAGINSLVFDGIPISFDFKGIIKMRGDQLLVLGIQALSGANAAVELANISACARVLVDAN